MKIVRIATDFSRYPAGRFSTDGPYSGEAFRRKHLEPYLEKNEEIVIEMDGARGYGSSFLEEAFGGLVRQGFAKELIKSKISFKVSNLSLKHEILEYIEQAQA
jgi:hypothetical protein